MAEKSGFFNSQLNEDGTYDRAYFAQDFAEYFASFIGNGVFPNPSTGLLVTVAPSGGMRVALNPGQAWINGYWYSNNEVLEIDLEPASGTQARIDAISIRWDISTRLITAVASTGEFALSPQAPIIKRNQEQYELFTAYVHIERGVISITQSNIVDARLDNNVCGLVHGVVEQIDTTSLGTQLQDFINEYMAKYNADYGDFVGFISNLRSLSQTAYQDYLTFLGQLRTASQLNADQFRLYVSTLSNDSSDLYAAFSVWLEAYKQTAQDEVAVLLDELRGLLDEDIAAYLLAQIQELQSRVPASLIGTIEHGLDKYPQARLYSVQYALGIGGLGIGPLGGTTLKSVEAAYELDGKVSIAVEAPKKYESLTELAQVEDMWFFWEPSPSTDPNSLILILE